MLKKSTLQTRHTQIHIFEVGKCKENSKAWLSFCMENSLLLSLITFMISRIFFIILMFVLPLCGHVV